MPFRSWMEQFIVMDVHKSKEILPYSEFQQGNYALYGEYVVMISYRIDTDKYIIALNQTGIKEVGVEELNPIELNDNVLKKCAPVKIKNDDYLFEFQHGTYRISVSPTNNYIEVTRESDDSAKIMFSNVVYSLHTLQNIIMTFAKHPISYKAFSNQNK